MSCHWLPSLLPFGPLHLLEHWLSGYCIANIDPRHVFLTGHKHPPYYTLHQRMQELMLVQQFREMERLQTLQVRADGLMQSVDIDHDVLTHGVVVLPLCGGVACRGIDLRVMRIAVSAACRQREG